MNLKPLGDRVIVKRLEAEEKTKGGIILTDSAKEKPKQGKIIAVGKGRVVDGGKVVAPQVKVGDKVIFSSYAGTEVKFNTEEFLIMREDDIHAIIED